MILNLYQCCLIGAKSFEPFSSLPSTKHGEIFPPRSVHGLEEQSGYLFLHVYFSSHGSYQPSNLCEVQPVFASHAKFELGFMVEL